MRCRVKDGAAYRDKAGRHHEAGAHVEVDEHEAAIIPWCLERAAEVDSTPLVVVDSDDELKPTRKTKPAKQDK